MTIGLTLVNLELRLEIADLVSLQYRRFVLWGWGRCCRHGMAASGREPKATRRALEGLVERVR